MAGVKAYTMWVRRYALHGLLHRLLGTHDPQVGTHMTPFSHVDPLTNGPIEFG